jgi:cytochrome c oxidase cbb3-type subunit III
MSDQKPESVVHVYDGIQEEDNHLPRWWLFILFGSAVFGFGYWFLYHTTHQLQTPAQEYAVEVSDLKKKLAMANPISEESLQALVKDSKALEEGKAVFTTTCAACHGPQGAGLVGPNLTDKFWIHGATASDIFKSARDGYPEKGMPAWGRVLGDDKIRKATAFVLTIKNTNLPGKAPQGDPVE